ncbi:hypothetical protein ING2D1G_0704 [Peptoniphilus sp. ING2-D1G]|nr:hypothetical protein ING2D1G_0704 [Peptoniphilus sp. ING2-D1G]
MTDEEREKLKGLYLSQIEDYCNVIFDVENFPAGVQLALDELVKVDPMKFNLTSEKLSDMAKTYSDNGGNIPRYILNWLAPYRRIHLAGNKEKRFYSGNKRC